MDQAQEEPIIAPESTAPNAAFESREGTDPRKFPIGLSYKRCSKLFQGILRHMKTAASSSEDPVTNELHMQPYEDLLENYRRFTLWSNNVGACHIVNKNYTISLDYRLREAKYYNTTVLSFLQNLEKVLLEADEIVVYSDSDTFRGCQGSTNQATGIGADFDLSARDVLESQNEIQQLEGLLELWDLSDEGLTAADLGLSDHDDGSSEKGSSGSWDGVEPTTCTPRITPLARLIRSVDNIVNCLYSLQLRKPANIDRHLNNEYRNPVGFYKEFDIRNVKDAYPQLDGRVAERLGELVTKRRGILDYRRQHHERLSSMGPIHDDTDGLVEIEQSVAGGSIRYAPTSRTKATTLLPEILDEEQIPNVNYECDTASDFSESSAASSEATKNNVLKFPRRPKDASGNPLQYFVCPICHLAQHITTEHSWRKHVLKDIGPYVCTFPDCSTPMEFFRSRKEWFQHESMFHRGVWHCNTNGHPMYENDSRFIQHIQEFHAMTLDHLQLQASASLFRRPNESVTGTCPFCSHTSERLEKHVGRHLELIAFRALGSLEEEDDVSDQELFYSDSDSVKTAGVELGTSELASPVETAQAGVELAASKTEYISIIPLTISALEQYKQACETIRPMRECKPEIIQLGVSFESSMAIYRDTVGVLLAPLSFPVEELETYLNTERILSLWSPYHHKWTEHLGKNSPIYRELIKLLFHEIKDFVLVDLKLSKYCRPRWNLKQADGTFDTLIAARFATTTWPQIRVRIKAGKLHTRLEKIEHTVQRIQEMVSAHILARKSTQQY
ncbi:hypothetical protein BJ508DRAFT_415053 [Ascobolus immersus RN42]|uniref:Oxidoreductase acuF-like C2H2 type zinc-finger domain-containing protein n=1 Tax=Ascobolus immersus RN42 TaxID=1160509 RepID=A0A3N4I4K3_ASCIM|nr:hypothetical protein BJ508DRAFT_415053 [Ascobolus immersus RN42]